MTPTKISGPEPFWKTVRLLSKTARRRASARVEYGRRLRRSKGGSWNLPGGLAIFIMAVFMAFLHGFMGRMTIDMVRSSALVAVERDGELAVSRSFLASIEHRPVKRYEFDRDSKARIKLGKTGARKPATTHALELDFNTDYELQKIFSEEAQRRTLVFGGTPSGQDKVLWDQYTKFGLSGFVRQDEAIFGIDAIRRTPALAQLGGTFLFVWWFVMLTMQGEGLELDVQRRRHPMWEWLLSHPAKPEAAFLAEMISPLVANAAYFTAPIYGIALLVPAFGFWTALPGGVILGLSFAIAAACLNKTLELCAMLKLSVRSRGAALGLMSWLGYALFIIPVFAFGKTGVLPAIASRLAPLASIFHPNVLRWLLGNWTGNNFSIVLATAASLGLSATIVTACALMGKWGTAAGLEGGFDSAPQTPRLLNLSHRSRFGREPLRRKELLWFLRDRSAVVQAVLIPLTVAALQAFNMKHMVEAAGHSWNGFSGLAVISGTYFLLVLGPKSLASEGPALWITMTWPRGLEDLLQAKARLWWAISSTIVFAVLLFAATRFPADLWRIALVAAGWWIFGRSLAEKAVTLVAAPSSSGETQPVPRHRQWTALLGTLAFGSGILTKNWHLAIIGVVFSSLTAAAIWQNLRARLPFLFDPWSEKLPPAPTLLHGMVAIAAMVEGIALTTAIFAAFGGLHSLNIARAIAYGLGSFVTWLIMRQFLLNRGVEPSAIWNWKSDVAAPESSARRGFGWAASIICGLISGALLGLVAVGYRQFVLQLPVIEELIRRHPQLAMNSDRHIWWFALLAIGFAPLAEEYLFRGLLYRALDREWGGWRALLGGAAFFAIYHPPMSWLPVGLLGLLNGFIFKKTGRLVPCVLCHIVYNATAVLVR